MKVKHKGDLELGHAGGLLDLDRGGILPARGDEELLDLLDLLGHAEGHEIRWFFTGRVVMVQQRLHMLFFL